MGFKKTGKQIRMFREDDYNHRAENGEDQKYLPAQFARLNQNRGEGIYSLSFFFFMTKETLDKILEMLHSDDEEVVTLGKSIFINGSPTPEDYLYIDNIYNMFPLDLREEFIERIAYMIFSNKMHRRHREEGMRSEDLGSY